MRYLYILTLLLLPPLAHAQTNLPQPIPSPELMTKSSPSQHFNSGDQVYELSVSGIQKYTESMKSQTELYTQLKPKAGQLQNAKYWAYGSGWGLGVGGLYLILEGGKSLPLDENGDLDSGDAKKRDQIVQMGFASIIAGMAAYYFIHPDHEDLLDFINFNNRVSNADLRFSFKVTPIGLLASYSL